MFSLIIVHGGAGKHAVSKDTQYKKACFDALIAGNNGMNENEASEMVTMSIECFENDAITNAGRGSNLNMLGLVECDASIMNNEGAFGAVGAVSGIRTPIRVALSIMENAKESVEESNGLVKPMMLVGEGAFKWALSNNRNIILNDHESLITEQCQNAWIKYQRCLTKEQKAEELQDTVGAIAVVIDGHSVDMAAGVSSGGLSLKKPGRVGQAGIYGSGCWSFRVSPTVSVGISVSGTGEQIIRTMFTQLLYQDVALNYDKCPLFEIMGRSLKSFLHNPLIAGYQEKSVGFIIVISELLKNEKKCIVDIGYGHTTQSMIVAWKRSDKARPEYQMSRKTSGDFSKPDYNRQQASKLLEQKIKEEDSIDILVLPEMAFSGYVFESRADIAEFMETTNGPSVQWAVEHGTKYGCFVLVGFPLKEQSLNGDEVFYNAAAFVSPQGELLHVYRKHFLYETDEKWSREGHAFESVHIDGLGQIGFGICMDVNPYQFTAPFELFEFATFHLENGTEILLCCMNWLTHEDQPLIKDRNEQIANDGNESENTEYDEESEEYFSQQNVRYWILRLSKLIKKNVMVAISNRIGREKESIFCGNSCIFDMKTLKGKYLSRVEENVLVYEVEQSK